MIIVETKDDLNLLLSKLLNRSFVMEVVPLDDERHAVSTEISLIFFSFTEMGGKWCLPVNHNEAVCDPTFLAQLQTVLKRSTEERLAYPVHRMVFDKKTTIQLLGADYGFVDLNIANYLRNGEPIEMEEFSTGAHIFIKTRFRDIKNANRCIPIYKHAHLFDKKLEAIEMPTNQEINETGFIFMNETMTQSFAWLEEAGLAVDAKSFLSAFGDERKKHIHHGKVHTQYNLFTATGRPSNRFGGVNYAALKKSGGERDAFISRHGKDGLLVMMDFNAFHPRLIAQLINFNLPGNINPYEYLAQHYFNKKVVDEEDIAVSKGLTFPQMYGGFDEQWMHIPYFAKIQEYIDHRWRFFEENGYIETPKYRRKIKPCHIQDATSTKLFNYILQAYETEVAVGVLNDLQLYLSGKKSTPILYTYDSVLFDCHKEDKMDTVKQIKSIMESSKFPVKVYVGKSYSDLEKIDV